MCAQNDFLFYDVGKRGEKGILMISVRHVNVLFRWLYSIILCWETFRTFGPRWLSATQCQKTIPSKFDGAIRQYRETIDWATTPICAMHTFEADGKEFVKAWVLGRAT